MSSYHGNQGGICQKILGGPTFSNDDVITAMTSLLLLYLPKYWGGRGPPGPPARYLPDKKDGISAIEMT